MSDSFKSYDESSRDDEEETNAYIKGAKQANAGGALKRQITQLSKEQLATMGSTDLNDEAIDELRRQIARKQDNFEQVNIRFMNLVRSYEKFLDDFIDQR